MEGNGRWTTGGAGQIRLVGGGCLQGHTRANVVPDVGQIGNNCLELNIELRASIQAFNFPSVFLKLMSL